MKNELLVTAPPALTMNQQELISVLQSSLYPGAKIESVKMVIAYCQAAGLDPMQKPVHIVPMSVKVGNDYQMRDVVMPGIGLYRTQASRSGEYAGVSEPEFGETKTLKVGDIVTEYPEWCRITVSRIVQGTVRTYTANERWLENYATARRDTSAPNAMWRRRPFAQLAKCAEAQALRKAFPEFIGSQPSAEEMEGAQVFENAPIEHAPGTPPEPPAYPESSFTANLPTWTKLIQAGKKTAAQIIATVETKGKLSDEQKKKLTDIKKAEPDALDISSPEEQREREPGEEG